MIDVTFVQPDGTRQTVSARPGDTLMDAALDHGINGIKAQCGGGCTCCTCHCWIEDAYRARLPAPHQDELDMLEYAWGRRHNSRLACQVVLDESLHGIVAGIPQQQS